MTRSASEIARSIDAPVRGQSHDPTLVNLVDPAQPVYVPVQEQDLGLHPLHDPAAFQPTWPAPMTTTPSRSYTWHASEQDAPRPVRSLQEMGSDLSGNPPGDLAHRREQGQIARRDLHGLVGHAGRLGLEQRLGHERYAGEVEVGE